MLENNIAEIVKIIEDKVANATIRNNYAVNAIRNAQCLRNDFRLYNVVRESFNYLTSSFKKYDGIVMMTNACMKIGGKMHILKKHWDRCSSAIGYEVWCIDLKFYD